jgi:hypothetical protein
MYYHPVGIFKGVSWTSNALGDSDPKVGDVCHVGSERYRFIYNAGAHTAAVGHAFVQSITVGSGGYSLTVSSTTSIDFAVGCVKHTAIAAGYYGWIVQEGMVNVQMGADHSAAVGNLLTLASDGKWAHKSCATGFLAPAQGKALSAIASAGSGLAYIFCT